MPLPQPRFTSGHDTAKVERRRFPDGRTYIRKAFKQPTAFAAVVRISAFRAACSTCARALPELYYANEGALYVDVEGMGEDLQGSRDRHVASQKVDYVNHLRDAHSCELSHMPGGRNWAWARDKKSVALIDVGKPRFGFRSG